MKEIKITKTTYRCDECGYETDDKAKMLKHEELHATVKTLNECLRIHGLYYSFQHFKIQGTDIYFKSYHAEYSEKLKGAIEKCTK